MRKVNGILKIQTLLLLKEDDKPIEDIQYGDINSDGSINVQDGVLCLSAVCMFLPVVLRMQEADHIIETVKKSL